MQHRVSAESSQKTGASTPAALAPRLEVPAPLRTAAIAMAAVSSAAEKISMARAGQVGQVGQVGGRRAVGPPRRSTSWPPSPHSLRGEQRRATTAADRAASTSRRITSHRVASHRIRRSASSHRVALELELGAGAGSWSWSGAGDGAGGAVGYGQVRQGPHNPPPRPALTHSTSLDLVYRSQSRRSPSPPRQLVASMDDRSSSDDHAAPKRPHEPEPAGTNKKPHTGPWAAKGAAAAAGPSPPPPSSAAAAQPHPPAPSPPSPAAAAAHAHVPAVRTCFQIAGAQAPCACRPAASLSAMCEILTQVFTRARVFAPIHEFLAQVSRKVLLLLSCRIPALGSTRWPSRPSS
jgi:hypothetical protein